MSKCRICTNELTKRNRSSLSGVCKFDFKFISPHVLHQLSEPAHFGRRIRDVSPSPTPELHERHMEALRTQWKGNPDTQVEIEVTVEGEYLYKEAGKKVEVDAEIYRAFKLRQVKSIHFPLPFNEASLIPPRKMEKKLIEVELTNREYKALMEFRYRRRRLG